MKTYSTYEDLLMAVPPAPNGFRWADLRLGMALDLLSPKDLPFSAGAYFAWGYGPGPLFYRDDVWLRHIAFHRATSRAVYARYVPLTPTELLLP